MNALILAAGRGTRLGLDDGRPKCLAQIGSRTLLDRYLDVLGALGCRVTVVAGYQADLVRAHVSARAGLQANPRAASAGNVPRIVVNPRYAEGSVVSLGVGLAEVSGPLLLLDGDVAFTPALLARLHAAKRENGLLVDVGTRFTDEQYMAGVRDGRVMVLRRGPADGHDDQGEWVGFARLGVAAVDQLRVAVNAQVARGETAGGYEDALAGLLADVEFACVPTGGLPWVEVDFAADLQRARDLFA